MKLSTIAEFSVSSKEQIESVLPISMMFASNQVQMSVLIDLSPWGNGLYLVDAITDDLTKERINTMINAGVGYIKLKWDRDWDK